MAEAPAREAIADALAVLLVSGILEGRKRMQATAALGLTFPDVEAALERNRRQGYAGPAGEPAAPVSKRRAWNRAPEGATRRCVRCGQVKPIDVFQQRTDASSRRTVCDDCRRQYSRNRYLSVETSEKLGTILRFVVEVGDPVEGDSCSNCHGPLRAGDEVVTGDVILVHHHNCPVEQGVPRG